MLSILKSLYFDQRQVWHSRNFDHFTSSGLILDVGCGRGDFALLARDRIIAIDLNMVSLGIAKKRGVKHLVRADVLRLPFDDATFENVHCADLLEHFGTKDVLFIVEELYRVLKRNGLLLISTPMPTAEFWGDPSHVRPYPPESLMGLFVDEKEKGVGTNPTFRSVGHASLLYMSWRYRPLVRLPWRLYSDENRRQFKNILHPCSLLFFISNLLARLRILKFWSPSGFSLLLRKK
jgi:SAM-dependent methyltransferase